MAKDCIGPNIILPSIVHLKIPCICVNSYKQAATYKQFDDASN